MLKTKEWLTSIKTIMDANSSGSNDESTDNEIDNHAAEIVPAIEGALMALPINQRESAIHATREWLFELEPSATKAFLRAFGAVMGRHVCDNKYGIKAANLSKIG